MLIQHHDRAKIGIIGGGVTGAALAYTLATFSNAGEIHVFEKNERLAAEASDGHSNSQTPHFGDIGTNFTIEKAKAVRVKADRLARYCERHNLIGRILHRGQKMALGVGIVNFDSERYADFLG